MPVPPAPARMADVVLAAGRDINSPSGLPVHLLFDLWMRDPMIIRGPDGLFYLTGTTNAPGAKADAWTYNDGIYLWKSTNLVNWESLGLVWSLDKDATWARAWKQVGTDPHWRRAVWAPGIHYIKGTYWIPYSMNYYEMGLLKSTSGKPEGPYVDVKPGGPMGDDIKDIDSTLFADDDGKVYYMWGARKIALMKDDMSDLAEAPRELIFPKNLWGEGSHMYKINGKYLFTNAGVPKNDNRQRPNSYDVNAAVSTSVYGPYSALYRALPFAGHDSLFQDAAGNWWSTFFGTDNFAPWGCKPGILPVTVDNDDNLKPKVIVEPASWSYTVKDPGTPDWTKPDFDDASWSKGQPGFGNPTITQFGALTVVNTPLPDLQGIWMRTKFDGPSTPLRHPAFYLRNTGPVKIYLNGELAADIPASDQYRTIPVQSPEQLHTGSNSIAFEGKNAQDLAYFDVGIVDLISP
jgi:hypothetical protein